MLASFPNAKLSLKSIESFVRFKSEYFFKLVLCQEKRMIVLKVSFVHFAG